MALLHLHPLCLCLHVSLLQGLRCEGSFRKASSKITWTLILPFLIVNGLLTGSFLEEPVVWYNDAQNLGIRIATIPVEDVFYGLLMILVVLTVYEALLGKRRRLTGA